MTPSEKAKSLGCKSLKQVSEKSTAKERTLRNWFFNKPKLFEIVCRGVVAHKESEK